MPRKAKVWKSDVALTSAREPPVVDIGKPDAKVRKNQLDSIPHIERGKHKEYIATQDNAGRVIFNRGNQVPNEHWGTQRRTTFDVAVRQSDASEYPSWLASQTTHGSRDEGDPSRFKTTMQVDDEALVAAGFKGESTLAENDRKIGRQWGKVLKSSLDGPSWLVGAQYNPTDGLQQTIAEHTQGMAPGTLKTDQPVAVRSTARKMVEEQHSRYIAEHSGKERKKKGSNKKKAETQNRDTNGDRTEGAACDTDDRSVKILKAPSPPHMFGDHSFRVTNATHMNKLRMHEKAWGPSMDAPEWMDMTSPDRHAVTRKANAQQAQEAASNHNYPIGYGIASAEQHHSGHMPEGMNEQKNAFAGGRLAGKPYDPVWLDGIEPESLQQGARTSRNRRDADKSSLRDKDLAIGSMTYRDTNLGPHLWAKDSDKLSHLYDAGNFGSDNVGQYSNGAATARSPKPQSGVANVRTSMTDVGDVTQNRRRRGGRAKTKGVRSDGAEIKDSGQDSSGVQEVFSNADGDTETATPRRQHRRMKGAASPRSFNDDDNSPSGMYGRSPRGKKKTVDQDSGRRNADVHMYGPDPNGRPGLPNETDAKGLDVMMCGPSRRRSQGPPDAVGTFRPDLDKQCRPLPSFKDVPGNVATTANPVVSRDWSNYCSPHN